MSVRFWDFRHRAFPLAARRALAHGVNPAATTISSVNHCERPHRPCACPRHSIAAARFHSFALSRIARDMCSRQSGCSRLTPP